MSVELDLARQVEYDKVFLRQRIKSLRKEIEIVKKMSDTVFEPSTPECSRKGIYSLKTPDQSSIRP